MAKQIGFAVVGLGTVARTSVLPAFAAIGGNSRLVAVVSGDRTKAQIVAREFKAAAYHYDGLRQSLQREDVNAVYIALPNSLHCDYAVEAARAGVHVLCEPPMAITADECRRMIRTCQTNRVKLMIAYRLHVRPAVVRALGLVRAGHVGIPKTFSADFTTRIEDPENTRLQRRLGGGTVYHLGVECIHAARSVLGAEPAGIEGLQDTRLIEAIYRSSRDGRPVTLPRLARIEPSPVDNDVRRASIEGRQAG